MIFCICRNPLAEGDEPVGHLGENQTRSYNLLSKQWVIMQMKLISCLLLAACLHVYAEGYSQKITLSERNTSLEKVFDQIKKQSGVIFWYESNLLRNAEKVSIHVRDAEFSDVLEQLFRDQPYSYAVIEKTVVVKPKTGGSHKAEPRIEHSSPVFRNPVLMTPASGKQIRRIADAPVQERIVRGKVTDESGEVLPGVSVLIKGTQKGTITDDQGSFSLDVPEEDAVLVFSFVGYHSQEVPVGNKTLLDVVLSVDTKTLEEIVVVGYGVQKKSDLTGAISSISSKDLAETPAGNFLEQSQGRLAGVDIVRSNGSPGAPVQIRIRGNRSINASNEPLYVIDGIPTTAGIHDFNPNDIESIEVLKDASAVAIYGSRGANGVVLVTTKKGKSGKAVISYDAYYGVKKPVENIDLMDGEQFARYARISRGIAGNDSSQDANFLADIEIQNLNSRRFTNWLDLAIKDGYQFDHQVSVSGGAEKINYYVSGSYFHEEGIIPGTDFDRVAFRVNLESKLTDRLKLGLSSSVGFSERNQMSNLPYNNSFLYSPLVGPTDEDGNFIAYPNPREGLLANPLINYQPYQYVDETINRRIFANIYAEYSILEGLKYRLNFGPDFSYGRRGQYTGKMAGNINRASVDNSVDFAYTLENILSYDKSFGRHDINLVGLYSVQASRFETSGLSGQDIPVEKSLFYDLASSSTITGIRSSLGKWGLLSYMGRLNYKFDDKFLLTLTGRADGSSRLAEGNKWAFFPAVSIGYILSEESFFPKNVVSFLKLRGGYGEVGNTAINPYQTMGGLSRSTYIFGTTAAFGYQNNLIPNPDLRWEISKTTNIGLDFGIWKDRISGSLEYYVTNTRDLLLNRLLPITSGYSSILQNIGSTRNSGIELSVSADIIRKPGGFTWTADLNFFANKEQIVELFDGESDDVGNSWFIGQPINVFYNFKQDGIWQKDEADQAALTGRKPGDIKIADVNGRGPDGELTKKPDGNINSDDRTVLGSTVPNWSGGLTNRFGYKGFDLSVLVYARIGQMLRSDFHNLGGNNWQGRYNALNLDYWTEDNPTNAIPRPNAAESPLYADAVRFFDGSFVKIKNVSLGYNFPSSVIRKIGLTNLRVYTTLNNALIFSPYKTVDPEVANGIVGSSSPLTTASYLFGINLKF